MAKAKRVHPAPSLAVANSQTLLAIATKLNQLQKAVIALAGVTTVFWAFWSYIDGPVPVSNHALAGKVNEVMSSVNQKVDITRNDLVRAVKDIQKDLQHSMQADLGPLKNQMELLARVEAANVVDNLETQKQSVSVLIQLLSGQLRTVEAAIAHNPDDQLALGRKPELDRFLRMAEQRLVTLDERINELRQAALRTTRETKIDLR